MSESVSFDRAAEYYDRTRSLPPEAMARIVEMLLGELSGRDPVIEIGVGTGRIALPLAERGLDIVGIDISAAMLAKLISKQPQQHSLPVAQADATALPFGDDRFGAALAIHVLHLIPDWRTALSEVRRVLRSGGVFIVGEGAWSRDVARTLDERFAQAAGIERKHRGASERAEIDSVLTEMGARIRPLPTLQTAMPFSIAEWVDLLGQGIFSFTWQIDEATRRRAAVSVKSWAKEHFPDINASGGLELTVQLCAYDLP